MRILGLDYGTKTVGVAVTDPLGMTVQPLETITRDSDSKIRPTLRRIEEIIKELDVEQIVLGLPLNMGASSRTYERPIEPANVNTSSIR